MNNINNALIIVAKRPAPGQTKTRLSPPLSPKQAASLYECFVLDTLNLIRQVPDIWPVLAYLPDSEKTYFHKIAPDFELIPQIGDNLGARLDNALMHFLKEGYEKVVIMDSDSPTLPVDYLTQAFQELSGEIELVIGPCDDGGYYLIGLKRPAPRLLREVRMSTHWVTEDTVALATKEGLSVSLLPQWYDVDDARSLTHLSRELLHSDTRTAPHTNRFLDELTRAGLLQIIQPGQGDPKT